MSEPLPRPAPPRSALGSLRAWIDWVGPARLAVTAVSIVVVVAGGYLLVRTPPPATEAALPAASSSPPPATLPPPATASPGPPSSTGGADTGALLVVHVAGAVAAPGVHELAPGSRVVDALDAAGGTTADATIDALNLAALLVDGQRIYVPGPDASDPYVGPPSGPAGAAVGDDPASPSEPLDLNRATTIELETLPGIGPATAAAIVEHRRQHGPFASVDQLDDVSGIGPATLAAVRDLVRV